jgi:hypothetical protein
LPDDTFACAKKLCDAREIAMAVLAHRDIGYMLSAYGSKAANPDWPVPHHPGPEADATRPPVQRFLSEKRPVMSIVGEDGNRS